MVTKIDNAAMLPEPMSSNIQVNLNETLIDTAIETYLETFQKHYKKQPCTVTGLSEFYTLVQNVLISRQNYDGIKEKNRILFMFDDPPEEDDIDTLAITFHLKNRGPGKFDQGPSGIGRIKEVTPHIRSVKQHPDNPGDVLYTIGESKDNYVGFNVYSRTSHNGLQTVEWFENAMSIYNWYFRIHGFRVVYQGCGGSDKIKLGNLKLIKYPMTYFVRYDNTYFLSKQMLRNIEINLQIDK